MKLKRVVSAIILIFVCTAMNTSAKINSIFADVTVLEKTNQIVVDGYISESTVEPVTIAVNDPSDELCSITQVYTKSDGKFSAAFKISKRKNGTYTVRIGSLSFGMIEKQCSVNHFKNLELFDFKYDNTGYSGFATNNSENTAHIDVYSGEFDVNGNYLNGNIESGTLSKNNTINFEGRTDSDAAYIKNFLWDDKLIPLADKKVYGTYNYFSNTECVYKGFAKGTIRPDEGTVEMRMRIDTSIDDFLSDYRFPFFVSAQTEIQKSSRTMMGMIFTPAETGGNIQVLLKNPNNFAAINYPYEKFSYTPGEEFVLAMTWKSGGRLKLYKDGTLLASSYMPEGLYESYIPYDFTVHKGKPFNISGVKISSSELSPDELANGAAGFKRSESTTYISDDGLSGEKYYVSDYFSGYSCIIPAWREEKQCYTSDEYVVYPVMYLNNGSEDKEYTIHFTVKNSVGEVVYLHDEQVTAKADSKYHIKEIKLPGIQTAGFYTVTANFFGSRTYTNNISVIPANRESVADGKYSESYGQVVAPRHSEEYVEKLNSKFTRDFNMFSWKQVEPEKGKFFWETTDAYVKRCKDAGISCLGMLIGIPQWAAREPTDEEKEIAYNPNPASWVPRSMDEWYNYVYEVVSRYKDDVKYWEVMNEVNYHPPYTASSFAGTTEDYANLLRTAYSAAKAADPSCYVLTAGFAAPTGNGTLDKDMPYEFTKPKYAEGYYDIYNIHGYNGTDVWKECLDNLRANRPDTPVWMSEFYPINYSDETDAAFYNVSTYFDFISIGCEKFLNMGTYGSEHFTTYSTKSPTLCYQATGVLQNLMRKCNEYCGKANIGENLVMPVNHQFARTDGKYLTAIGNNISETVTIRIKGKIDEAYDMLGNIVNIDYIDGNSILNIDNNIVYILSADKVNAEITDTKYENIISNGGFEQDLSDWTVRTNGGTVRIDNETDAENGKALSVIGSYGQYNYVFQAKSIPSGGKYKFSAKVKLASGTGATAFLRFFNLDKWNNNIEPSIEDKYFRVTSSDYTEISWTIDIPQSKEFPHNFFVGIKDGGSILVDDVQLRKTDE